MTEKLTLTLEQTNSNSTKTIKQVEFYAIPFETKNATKARIERAHKAISDALEDVILRDQETVTDGSEIFCESCEKVLHEGDDYTTCSNSGTSECKDCEVSRLKLESVNYPVKLTREAEIELEIGASSDFTTHRLMDTVGTITHNGKCISINQSGGRIEVNLNGLIARLDLDKILIVAADALIAEAILRGDK